MKTITKKARHLGLAASTGLALSFAAGSAQASDCGEVSITEMDWGSAIIVTQVAKLASQISLQKFGPIQRQLIFHSKKTEKSKS
jgi:hypothetical protein